MSDMQIDATTEEMVRVNDTVEIEAGKTQLVINLPKAVPEGKKLSLNVSIAGRYLDVQTEQA